MNEIVIKHERIISYEGWSVNNIKNHMNFKVGEGVIALVSDKDINDVEVMGIESIVKHMGELWQGLDLDIVIAKGYYNKKLDAICNTFNNEKVNHVSDKFPEYNKEMWDNYKSIICINYTAISRNAISVNTSITSKKSKSNWWRLCNKRKLKIVNVAI